MGLSVCPAATVAAPAETVWALLASAPRWDNWIDGRVERVEPGPLAPGQTVAVLAPAFDRTWRSTFVIEDVDAERGVLAMRVAFPLGMTLPRACGGANAEWRVMPCRVWLRPDVPPRLAGLDAGTIWLANVCGKHRGFAAAAARGSGGASGPYRQASGRLTSPDDSRIMRRRRAQCGAGEWRRDVGMPGASESGRELVALARIRLADELRALETLEPSDLRARLLKIEPDTSVSRGALVHYIRLAVDDGKQADAQTLFVALTRREEGLTRQWIRRTVLSAGLALAPEEWREHASDLAQEQTLWLWDVIAYGGMRRGSCSSGGRWLSRRTTSRTPGCGAAARALVGAPSRPRSCSRGCWVMARVSQIAITIRSSARQVARISFPSPNWRTCGNW